MSTRTANRAGHPPLALGRTEAARVCGVSIETLSRAVATGHLRAKRTSVDADGAPAGKYLFFPDDLREWLNSLEDA